MARMDAPMTTTIATLLQGSPPAAEAPRLELRLRRIGRLLAIVLCGLHAWVARHTMNPDGISYLDLADAYGRGDWANALNTYWSPLYCWILEAVFAAVRPTPYWECAVVHAVNLALFLTALVCFECLLGEVLKVVRCQGEATGGETQTPLPCWVVLGLMYALFIWTSRQLITVSHVTPDMIVAACVYLAAALLLRMRRTQTGWRLSLALGLVLGVGYLAKAVLFPLGFVFLAISALAAGSWRRAARHLAVAGSAFLVVSGCFILVLSLSQGRATFGDSGRLNYAWFVGGVKREHWQGGPLPGLQAAHPPRLIFQSPAVYDISGPVGGTYPLWFNPSYWYEGVRAPLQLRAQAAAVARTAVSYLELLSVKMGGFTAALGALWIFCLRTQGQSWRARTGQWLGQVCRQYLLLGPALAAVAMYLLVGHVEGRLIGPFLLLLGAGLLAAMRLAPPRLDAACRLGKALLGGVAVLLAINVAFDGFNAVQSWRRGEGSAAHPAWQLAHHLREHGFREGDCMAFIGYTYDAYWARLGGYRIVGEVPEGEAPRFWGMPDPVRREVLARLAQTGARAVVAENAAGDGWEKVSGTSYSVYILPGGGPEGGRSLAGVRGDARPHSRSSVSLNMR
jgi:hypothetical protein